ncbi:MAG: DUF4167 domain-containing protein [Rhizobiaceae bacterium]
MRPGQQNRRMRGRNNNNRKGPNPLTRNYESNGPDVKIRGSAQQIAEKYASLARDAQSSGDRVMAENYLQHAEHYNRIILAAQAQMPIQHMRDNRDNFDDENDEEREDAENPAESAGAQPERRPRQHTNDGSGPQPVIEGVPAEVAMHQAQSRSPGAEQPAEQINGHHVNGHGAEKAEEAESGEASASPSRRSRKPRRPRRTEADGVGAEGASERAGEAASPAETAESGDLAAE